MPNALEIVVTKMTFGIVLVSIACGCLLVLNLNGAEPENDQRTAASPFAGKIVVLSSLSEPDSGTVLHGATVRRLGERSFLVGTGADYGHPLNWQKGRTVWAPVADLGQIVEFNDIEEYMESIAQYDDSIAPAAEH